MIFFLLLITSIKDVCGVISKVIIASFFHITVLFALPLYFVFTLRYSHKIMILLIIGSIIVGSYFPVLMRFSADMDSRYSIYSEIEGGGQLFAVFYVLDSKNKYYQVATSKI